MKLNVYLDIPAVTSMARLADSNSQPREASSGEEHLESIISPIGNAPENHVLPQSSNQYHESKGNEVSIEKTKFKICFSNLFSIDDLEIESGANNGKFLGK